MDHHQLMNNSRGFSMVQTLISIGLIGLVFYGFAKLVRENTRVAQNNAWLFETSFIIDEMRGFLSDPKVCTEALSGKNARTEELEKLLWRANDGNFAGYEVASLSGKTYGQDDLVIEEMYLSDNEKNISVDVNTTQLVLKFRGKDTTIPGLIEKRINLFIETDSRGYIRYCESSPSVSGLKSDNQISLWSKVKGSQDYFFNGKKVLIGQTNISGPGLASEYPLKLMKTSLTCGAGDVGALIYDGSRLMFCDKRNRPKPLRIRPISFQKKDVHVLLENQIKNVSKGSSICQIINNVPYSHCKIEQLSRIIQLKNIASKSCQFECYSSRDNL